MTAQGVSNRPEAAATRGLAIVRKGSATLVPGNCVRTELVKDRSGDASPRLQGCAHPASCENSPRTGIFLIFPVPCLLFCRIMHDTQSLNAISYYFNNKEFLPPEQGITGNFSFFETAKPPR
jgi:hypothetical protein